MGLTERHKWLPVIPMVCDACCADIGRVQVTDHLQTKPTKEEEEWQVTINYTPIPAASGSVGLGSMRRENNENGSWLGNSAGVEC